MLPPATVKALTPYSQVSLKGFFRAAQLKTQGVTRHKAKKQVASAVGATEQRHIHAACSTQLKYVESEHTA